MVAFQKAEWSFMMGKINMYHFPGLKLTHFVIKKIISQFMHKLYLELIPTLFHDYCPYNS